MSNGNKIRWTVVIALILFLAYIYVFAFISSGVTCAKVTIISSMGTLGKDNAYKLKYYVNDEEFNVSLGKSFFKEEISFDSLKKMECIKIEYSKLTPSLIKLIDEKVVAD